MGVEGWGAGVGVGGDGGWVNRCRLVWIGEGPRSWCEVLTMLLITGTRVNGWRARRTFGKQKVCQRRTVVFTTSEIGEEKVKVGLVMPRSNNLKLKKYII
jgi:hypothetical protein